MIDLSFIGKDGLIIQYEDVISLMGFNVIRYMILHDKGNDAMKRMSLEDILLSYINRPSYDIDQWIKNTFGLDMHYLDARESIPMVIPNFIYAYKLFMESHKQQISSLWIHTNEYYKGIETTMLKSFDVPIQYIHGDIVPVLQEHPNITYITSCPDNIMKCLEVTAPFVLTIVDDFSYIGEVLVKKKIEETLRHQGKFVFYTSILSGGLTNVGISKS